MIFVFSFFSSIAGRKERKEVRAREKPVSSIPARFTGNAELASLRQAAFLHRKTLGPEGLSKGGDKDCGFMVNIVSHMRI